MGERRHHKVLKLQILKPLPPLTWKELGDLLREVRYRTYRLANLAVSNRYLEFHLFRTRQADQFKTETLANLNKALYEMLQDEPKQKERPLAKKRLSDKGALPATVCDALSKYKIAGLTSKTKWQDVIRGKVSLPNFKLSMAIPVRCDKRGQRRLERSANGDVELDLMVTTKPYPRVVLATRDRSIGEGALAILNRLLDNKEQLKSGYRQRCFEVKFDDRDRQWWLYVSYDFPAEDNTALKKDVVVGVDLGESCPLYVAISNGHARLGRREFAALKARVRHLQGQVFARRRSMLQGGKSPLAGQTARAGHGRKRHLASIEKLEGRINDAYRTLNHQFARAVVHFARHHGAGLIQIEDLEGLHDELSPFLRQRWRYHELQEFITYKAAEAGIEAKKVNPKFTSRRCGKCGHIHVAFSREFRDSARKAGKTARFQCPSCLFEADADYNAALNLATLDIEAKIKQQCQVQGLIFDK